MKKLFIICSLLLVSVLGQAQNLYVTATITDNDGQTWNNGTWSAVLQSPNGKLFYNGVLIPAQSVSGTLSSSGVLSASLYNTNTITPGGATYVFTICALTPAPCSIITTPVTQSNLSTLLSSQVTAPRFPATPTSYGYLDVEITPIPSCGGQYFNTTQQVTRQWNCTAAMWEGYCTTTTGCGSAGITSINGNNNAAQTITGSGTASVSSSGGTTTVTGTGAPLYNPTGGQNNYAPIDSPTFTTRIVTPELDYTSGQLRISDPNGVFFQTQNGTVEFNIDQYGQTYFQSTGADTTSLTVRNSPNNPSIPPSEPIFAVTGSAGLGYGTDYFTVTPGGSSGPATINFPSVAALNLPTNTYYGGVGTSYIPCTPASGTCGSAGGNTNSTALTTNTLPKANGANSIVNSSLSDNGTTVSTSEPIAAGYGSTVKNSGGAAQGVCLGDGSTSTGTGSCGVTTLPSAVNNLILFQSGSGTSFTGQVGGCVGTFPSQAYPPSWTKQGLRFTNSQVTMPNCFDGAQTVIIVYQNDWGLLKARGTFSPIFSSDNGTDIIVQGNKPLEGATLGGALRSGDHAAGCTAAIYRLGSSQLATLYGSKQNSVYSGYTGAPSSLSSTSHYYFGNYEGSSGYSWPGLLLAFATSNSVLSDSDTDATWAYIKNSLRSNGVACDNTVDYTKGLYVADGDSILDNSPLGYLWDGTTPNQAVDYLGLVTDLYNYGITGDTTTGNLSEFPTKVLPTLELYGGASRAVEEEAGTNDIAAGATNTTILANYTSYCALVHTAGAKCIVDTTLPRSAFLGTAMETQRLALNSAIVTSPSTYNIDIINDRAANPIIGNTANLGTCTFDGIHPTPTCTAYLVPMQALAMHRAFSPREPFWFNTTINPTAYAGTTGTRVDFPLFNLLPGERVCGASLVVNIAFSGGGIPNFQFYVGDTVSGTSGVYINAVDGTTVVSTLNLNPNYYRSPSLGVGTVDIATLVASGNVSAVTAGSANVSVCVVSNP